MNIGIDARPLTYRLTGIGVYLRNLLDAIQRIDRENRYYLISNGPIGYDLENPKWFKIEGHYKEKFTSSLWMQCHAPILASRLRLDLFWGPRHHLPLFLSSRLRTVVTIHDIVHLLHPGTMPMLHLLAERLLMRWSVLRADKIMAVSRSTTSGIQKAYKVDSDRVKTISSGVPDLRENATLFINGNRALPSQYFLFVGTLEPRKNFERIFKAFELVNPQHYGVHLVIVGGEGWKNKAFVHMLKGHPLSPYIHLTGYADPGELPYFYRKARCLVFPSLYEGFGFPILEAMASGTPVITSNTSAMPEVAGDAAILVDPYDVEALAEAMHKILTNEELGRRLTMKGFERVKEFSWERCARETLEVFNMLGC